MLQNTKQNNNLKSLKTNLFVQNKCNNELPWQLMTKQWT